MAIPFYAGIALGHIGRHSQRRHGLCRPSQRALKITSILVKHTCLEGKFGLTSKTTEDLYLRHINPWKKCSDFRQFSKCFTEPFFTTKYQNSTSNVLWPQQPQKWLCQMFFKIASNQPILRQLIWGANLLAIKVDPNLSSWQVWHNIFWEFPSFKKNSDRYGK